jgi:hypothetical protein
MAGSCNVAGESRRMCFAMLPLPCDLCPGSGRTGSAFFGSAFWACRKKRLIQQGKTAGRDRDGEEGFRGALGGAEADGVVGVVDEFERGGIARSHFRKNCLIK